MSALAPPPWVPVPEIEAAAIGEPCGRSARGEVPGLRGNCDEEAAASIMGHPPSPVDAPVPCLDILSRSSLRFLRCFFPILRSSH